MFITQLLFSAPFPFLIATPSSLFLLATLKPPTNNTKASKPSTTTSVTTAPMTPATGLETPPPPPLPDPPLLELGTVLAAFEAHTPVLFPHAAHHALWSPMANLLIPAEKSFQESTVLGWPNSGYATGGSFSLAVPFLNRKRTLVSSGVGKLVLLTEALVTSSKTIVEA